MLSTIVYVWQIAKTCMNNQKFSYGFFCKPQFIVFLLLLRNVTGFVE